MVIRLDKPQSLLYTIIKAAGLTAAHFFQEEMYFQPLICKKAAHKLTLPKAR